MQNCFIVLALQHGRRENPLYDGFNSDEFIYFCDLISLSPKKTWRALGSLFVRNNLCISFDASLLRRE